jgi:hypothetical protein
MLIVRHNIGKKFIDLLLKSNLFNRHFAVLLFDKAYVIKKTKPIDELLKIKITEDNILSLKFDYHSSFKILQEYEAEICKHNYEGQKLHFNIWTSEEKTELIKTAELDLTNATNEKVKTLLDSKIFNEKYGSDYNYFISLYIKPDIKKVDDDNRKFAEITLKYSLKPNNKETEMRHKTKFDLTKKEARKLCSIISYWKV